MEQMARLPLPRQPAASGSPAFVIAPYQILSWWPRIVSYPGFLTPAQAEYIRLLAAPRMAKSTVVKPNGTSVRDRARTSDSAFLFNQDDPGRVLNWLDSRIADATLIPVSHGEPSQVLRYARGQFYESHMDSFDPVRYGPQATMRMATVLVYLSDVEDGGETVFGLEGERWSQERFVNFKQSACGAADFKYRPRMGDAVVFYSLDHDSTLNYRAMHGGCPVKSGEKWVLTKCLHNKPYPKRAALLAPRGPARPGH